MGHTAHATSGERQREGPYVSTPSSVEHRPADSEGLARIDAYWRAANYLSVGQVYLLDDPLLREPLRAEHVKPRLLGHFGTVPGLNLVYAHMARPIAERDLDTIFIGGPGHGGPAVVANAYLEGTYSEVYPDITRDEDGLRRLFRQFSFPGGIPSHAAPETPGSINEGGELGYSLVHAFGAAFDAPEALIVCVIGDGEAETGPLATSWHSNKFLDPEARRRGPAHPSSERVQDRQPDRPRAHPPSRTAIAHGGLWLRGPRGHRRRSASGPPPDGRHPSTPCSTGRLDPTGRTSGTGTGERPRWPMIVLRTRRVDGTR